MKNNKIKNTLSKALTSASVTAVLVTSKIMMISAETTPGFDLEEAKKLTDGYTAPLKQYFLYIIPAVVVIAASILGVKYFFKKEEEKEDFDIYGKLINYGLVASVIQSLAVFMRIFGIM